MGSAEEPGRGVDCRGGLEVMLDGLDATDIFFMLCRTALFVGEPGSTRFDRVNFDFPIVGHVQSIKPI